MLLWLAGCVPQVTTEQGQIIVEAADLKLIEAGEGTAPMLEGSETCPVLLCAADCPQSADPLECFALSPSELLDFDGTCWRFPTPGTARMDFLQQDCAANAEGYTPVDDGLSFQVVSADQVEARTTDIEAMVSALLSPGPGQAFPEDWGQPEGEPWRIVEGQQFRLLPQLISGGQEVAWTLAQGGARAENVVGETPLLSYAPAEISVILEEGSRADISLVVGEHSWPMAQVVGVASDSPESLEIFVGYLTDLETQTDSPAGARAVVRNAQGELVWGAPIVWTLEEGLLALGEPSLTVPSADYLLLADACVAPSQNAGPHTAVLRASVDGLTATATLEWTVPEGQPDDGFVPSEYCVGWPEPTPTTDDTSYVVDPEPSDGVDDEVTPEKQGCGCASGGSPRGVGLLLALIAGRYARRRGEGGSLVSQCGGKV